MNQMGGWFVMKKILIGVTFAVLAVGVASAADMPVRGRSVVPQPLPPADAGWAGWYMGVNAGGSWGTVQVDYSTPFESTSRSPRTSGFTGGLQAGYNWQSGIWV
jgi:outer membrane immunogenic protein